MLAILSPLTSRLGLCTLGIHFLLENALTLLLGFGLVDLFLRVSILQSHRLDVTTYMFNESTLVLERITLAEMI
jgi:hypothetical protein